MIVLRILTLEQHEFRAKLIFLKVFHTSTKTRGTMYDWILELYFTMRFHDVGQAKKSTGCAQMNIPTLHGN